MGGDDEQAIRLGVLLRGLPGGCELK